MKNNCLKLSEVKRILSRRKRSSSESKKIKFQEEEKLRGIILEEGKYLRMILENPKVGFKNRGHKEQLERIKNKLSKLNNLTTDEIKQKIEEHDNGRGINSSPRTGCFSIVFSLKGLSDGISFSPAVGMVYNFWGRQRPLTKVRSL
ncbi:hypothetical protein [Xanthovirga aplysinae]|uniref:hypothetical protein n=1 Tax=Xanthovirga aplysinae TaxID=2529853 RepID=UPI0012BC6079|nr:hypothetical protein [Xanthovirga aplysinae]MTI31424.1 hypothetical protein [Xanthovirga aplysinae]